MSYSACGVIRQATNSDTMNSTSRMSSAPMDENAHSSRMYRPPPSRPPDEPSMPVESRPLSVLMDRSYSFAHEKA